jgi:hypothetical protein
MSKALLIVPLLMLTGCITDQDTAYFDRYLASYYSRADVDAINAEIVCKQAARNLVQIARCETRR